MAIQNQEAAALMQKDKLLLLFPDGVGIRNYLYSGVFDHTQLQTVLMHNFKPDTIDYLEAHNHISEAIVIPDYSESPKERFLRELITLCRLRHSAKKCNNPTILINWNVNKNTLSRRLFYTAVETAAAFYSGYEAILKLEKRYQKALRQNPFYDSIKHLLQQIQPKRIFCSHQRAMKMPAIFAAARDLGIESSTVIYSWDNLPKARMALRADQYLVWSEFMKQELIDFYPEIPQQSIIVTGTPQFQFYGNPKYIIGKSEFFQKYGLDANKKIICFSGDDEITSPDDPKYLNDVAQAIADAGLQDRYQILLRRCPVDLSQRYDAVTGKFDFIKEAPPLWHFKNSAGWTEVYPLYDDVALLVSTAYYCDLVINLGSTMAFDFAMFDKPCLFINYDQPHKENPDWSVDTVYQFQHFRTMQGLEPVGWINNVSDIVPLVMQSVEDPSSVGRDRKLWMERVAGNPFSAHFTTVTS